MPAALLSRAVSPGARPPCSRSALWFLLAGFALPAYATIGYLDYGYGVKTKGLGGAGVAFPQDALAPATNPAGNAFLADRVDLGLVYLQPDRAVSLGPNRFEGNESDQFFVPEFGVRAALSPQLSLGLAVYGNGGIKTDFATPLPGFGLTPVSTDLNQYFVAPTLTYQFRERHALGLAPLLAYQRIEARGLEFLIGPNRGADTAYGGGARLGYTGQWAEWLTVGLTYQTRIYTSDFERYRTLLPEQGSFDTPSNFAAGVALRPAASVTFALDVERILFSEVRALGNLLTPTTFANGLGSREGPGFGARDVTVVKTGVAWQASDPLTLRLGYTYNTQPIRADQTYFNALSTGILQHHASVGFTWRVCAGWEVSGFYAHAFAAELAGKGNFNNVNYVLYHHQNSVGLSVGWLF